MDISIQQFKDALASENVISKTSLEALNTLFYAPECKIDGRQIAKIMGYSDFQPVNAIIGNFGKRIAEYLGIKLEREDSSPGWWRLICTGEYIDELFNWKLKDELAEALIEMDLLEEFSQYIYPENETSISKVYLEGKVTKTTVNTFERNYLARKQCINFYKPICNVCGIDFEKIYGSIGKGFIHVHHVIDISLINKEYKVDAIKDLIPVCPNCHAMLHQKRPAYSITELKEIIAKK